MPPVAVGPPHPAFDKEVPEEDFEQESSDDEPDLSDLYEDTEPHQDNDPEAEEDINGPGMTFHDVLEGIRGVSNPLV